MRDLPDAEYKLFANGTEGMIFDNATDVELVKKSFSVFVQTDKAIYKPGDLINYRILLLDPNMKPAPIEGSVNIYLNVISSYFTFLCFHLLRHILIGWQR